jgi:hypothetical protein
MVFITISSYDDEGKEFLFLSKVDWRARQKFSSLAGDFYKNEIQFFSSPSHKIFSEYAERIKYHSIFEEYNYFEVLLRHSGSD